VKPLSGIVRLLGAAGSNKAPKTQPWLWVCGQSTGVQFAASFIGEQSVTELKAKKTVNGSGSYWVPGSAPVHNVHATASVIETFPSSTVPKAVLINMSGRVFTLRSYVATKPALNNLGVAIYESPSVMDGGGRGAIEWVTQENGTAIDRVIAMAGGLSPTIKKTEGPDAAAAAFIAVAVLVIVLAVVCIGLGSACIAKRVQQDKAMVNAGGSNAPAKGYL
jgi:hypothetical protein